jgi:conjugal transfer pilus assembly protein TraB
VDARLQEYAKSRGNLGTPTVAPAPVAGTYSPAPYPVGPVGPVPQPMPELVMTTFERSGVSSQTPAAVQANAPTSASPPASATPAKRTFEPFYLPRGSFGKVVLLSGADAPTSGATQSNPQPVLMQLKEPARLPNHERYGWQECLVTGSATGNLSTERAEIRLESLSCVSKDGDVIDVEIRGFVASEDGKAGMRGRLVEKRGEALRAGIYASVLSGLGGAIASGAQTSSTSTLGTISTTNSGSEGFRQGFGQSMQRNFDRYAQYYLTVAEKLFPVIEVDAGRTGDLVLMKGVKVEPAL